MKELHFMQYIDALEEYNRKYKECLKRSEQQEQEDKQNPEEGKWIYHHLWLKI